MDYELLTNGNVKIGQKAPDFEADTTFGEIRLEDYPHYSAGYSSMPDKKTLTVIVND